MATFSWKSVSLLLAGSLFSVPINAGQPDSVCSRSPYSKFLTLSNYGPAETYCSSKYPLPVVTVTAQPKIRRGDYNYPKCRPIGPIDTKCGDACWSFSTLITKDPGFVSTLCSCIETPSTTTVYAITTATTSATTTATTKSTTSGQPTSTATSTSTTSSTQSTSTSSTTSAASTTTTTTTTTTSAATTTTTTTVVTTTTTTVTSAATTTTTSSTSSTTSATTTSSILPCASIALGSGLFILKGTASSSGTIYFQDAQSGLQNFRGTADQTQAKSFSDSAGVLSYLSGSTTKAVIAGGNNADPLYNAPLGYYDEPPGSKTQITIDPGTCAASVYANFGDITVPNPTIVSKNVLLFRPNNNNGLSLQAPLDQLPAGAETVTNLIAIPL